MVPVFNLEELKQLLKDFYLLTSIRITVFDTQLQELMSYPEECAPFCKIIRRTDEGAAACIACDRAACKTAAGKSKAYIYRCHAGLTEAIMPLRTGNVLVGYLLFGHIFAYNDFDSGWEQIKKHCAGYPVDASELRAALPMCPNVSTDYIKAAAHILHTTASYLVLERLATLQEDSLAAQLDAYISAHFTERITTKQMCEALGVGRSRLYKLAGQIYGCGISQHIRDLRIARAKELLTGRRDMNIAGVAEACGFTDYNYFISVFSKLTGISPGAYRTQISHDRT